MVNADSFSKALLQRAAERGIEVDPLKLQKLTYYCQGYHLAAFGKPAVDAELNAWDHGPVVKEMYVAYQHFGSKPISLELQQDLFSQLEESVKRVIDWVLDMHGQFRSWDLRNQSHKEAPWMAHYNPQIGCVDYQAISHEELSSFFKEQLAGRQDAYFQELMSAADCESVEVPDSIETTDEFYRWVMDDSQS
jgi:uncharacterized phage-associated protein